MKAIYAARASMEDPISALEVGEIAEPVIPDGWVRVRIKSASLNHHLHGRGLLRCMCRFSLSLSLVLGN